MKLIKVGSLVVMACLMAACSNKGAKKEAPEIKTTIKKSFSEATFQGDINVVFKPVKKGSKLVLKGEPEDLAQVKSQVTNGHLLVPAHFYGRKHYPVTAEVYTTQLNGLTYEGRGNLSGKGLHTSLMNMTLVMDGNVNLSGKLNIRELMVSGKNKIKLKGVTSRNLSINMHGKPDVILQGVANLKTLRYRGKGKLALHWLDSSDLEILGYGEARVFLAGVARYVHAVIHDTAELDARYLRITKSYIKATDNSIVRIAPITEMNAFASDNGHIYYYQSPKFKAEYMAQNGAILNFVRYR